jgi:hypothetical protein
MKIVISSVLFAIFLSTTAQAQTSRQIVPGDVGIQVPFGAVGDLLVAGPTTSKIQDSSAVPYVTLPTNLNLTKNVTLGSATLTPSQSPIYWDGTIAGTTPDSGANGWESAFFLHAIDSAFGAGNAPYSLLHARLQLTGTRGLRNAIQSYISIDQSPDAGDTSLQNYVSMSEQGYTQAPAKTGLVGGATFSGYAGNLWGSNPNVYTANGAVHWSGLYGSELDTAINSGSDVAERYGVFVVSSGSNYGTIDDAAIEMTGSNNYGIEFGGVRHNWFANNAFIVATARTQGGAFTPTAPYGVDFRSATFSTAAWASPGITIDGSGNISAAGVLSAAGGVGYTTGAGGTITQASSRTTGVTLNKTTGAITLVSAAGSATYNTFTVTNSSVAATDIIHLSQKSGTDKYILHVTNVSTGSFAITFATTGGTTTEQPVINFAVIKGSAS